MSNLKVGMVIADENEFEPIKQMADKLLEYNSMLRAEFKAADKDVVAVLCGIGTVNAAIGATCLACEGVDCMLSVGYSGGMKDTCINQTVVGTQFVEHDFDLSPIGYKKAEKPNQKYIYTASKWLNDTAKEVFPDVSFGSMVSGDCFVSDDGLKNQLIDLFDATCCDMETSAVASVCEKFKIPFTAIRRVSDDAGDDAYDDYKDAVNKYEMSLMNMAVEIIKNIKKVGYND